VVRPIVVEDWKPAPQPPIVVDPDKAEKPFELSGGSLRIFENTYSISSSESRQYKQQETGRTGDVMRVYNPEDDEQYVDVEVPHAIRHVGGDSPRFGKATEYEPMEPAPNTEKIGEFERGDTGGGDEHRFEDDGGDHWKFVPTSF
jgi:hypothetical protein